MHAINNTSNCTNDLIFINLKQNDLDRLGKQPLAEDKAFRIYFFWFYII